MPTNDVYSEHKIEMLKIKEDFDFTLTPGLNSLNVNKTITCL